MNYEFANFNKYVAVPALICMSISAFAMEEVDPVRAKACEDYVRSIGTGVNQYTGEKYSKFVWQSLYETLGMYNGNPRFGRNYTLQFRIQMKNENGTNRGEGANYFCVSDLKTKKVIGFEFFPQN